MRRRQDEVVGLVLAGGRGVRMGSVRPKALQLLRGQCFLDHVLQAVRGAGVEGCAVVVGEHHEEHFSSFFTQHPHLGVCVQDHPLGTAHAVGCGGYLWPEISLPSYCAGALRRPAAVDFSAAGSVLICLGDVPALCSDVLRAAIDDYHSSGSDIVILTMEVPDPSGYGRVLVGGQGEVVRIVEERHADEQQKKINLCFTGVMLARIAPLFAWLSRLQQRSSGEYYLTDLLPEAYKDGSPSKHFLVPSWQRFMGVNTQRQLGEMERFMRL